MSLIASAATAVGNSSRGSSSVGVTVVVAVSAATADGSSGGGGGDGDGVTVVVAVSAATFGGSGAAVFLIQLFVVVWCCVVLSGVVGSFEVLYCAVSCVVFCCTVFLKKS